MMCCSSALTLISVNATSVRPMIDGGQDDAERSCRVPEDRDAGEEDDGHDVQLETGAGVVDRRA